MVDNPPFRILVVDDEPGVRTLLANALRIKGYEIETAPDGEAALAMFKTQDFDLVILDSRLPGLSGAEVVDELERLPAEQQPKVILVTGRITQRIGVDRCLVADVLRKPFEIASLHRTVEWVLKSSL